jgi:hypothetical protein
MSVELNNNFDSSTKEGIRMTSDVEFFRDSANVLRTPDNLTIDLDIYQDDVVYPYVSYSFVTGLTTITIKVRRFDAADSANNYHHVHWWISSSSYGAPATLPNYGSGHTLALTSGTRTSGTALPITLNTTNTGLQTHITTSNEIITLTITATDGGTGNQATGYIMTEVQGVLYSTLFYYDDSV